MVPSGLLRRSLGRMKYNKAYTYVVDGVEEHYRELGWHTMVRKGMSAVWDDNNDILWNGLHVTNKEFEAGRAIGGRHVIRKKEEWIYVILNKSKKGTFVTMDLRVGAQEIIDYLLKDRDCEKN